MTKKLTITAPDGTPVPLASGYEVWPDDATLSAEQVIAVRSAAAGTSAEIVTPIGAVATFVPIPGGPPSVPGLFTGRRVVLEAGGPARGWPDNVWVQMDRRFGQTDRPLVNTTSCTVRRPDMALQLLGRKLNTPERMSNGQYALYECGGVWTRGQSDARIPQYHAGRAYLTVPHGFGVWPAFWMTDRHGGGECEFDMLELFHAEEPGLPRSTLFCDTDRGAGYSKKVKQVKGSQQIADMGALDGPEICLEWTITRPTGGVRFQTWVNAVPVMDYTETSRLRWLANNNPDDAWDILINLQLGGPWVGDPADRLGYLSGPRRLYDRPGLRRYGHVAGDEKAGETKLAPIFPVDDFVIRSLQIAA